MPGPLKGYSRPTERRTAVAVRMTDAEREPLDELATELGVLRSDVIRWLIAEAVSRPAVLTAVRKRAKTGR